MTDARPADLTSPLSTADALAEAGHWLAAIEAWQGAAAEHPSLQPAVERRLEWFLSESGYSPRSWRRTLPPVLAFLAMTTLGTSFLMFAGEPGSTGANLWAAATWVAIVVAMVAALVGARRSHGATLGDLVSSAMRAAERIECEHDKGESR